MAQPSIAIVQVPHFQGIWRPGVIQKELSLRRKPLREEIQVRHPQVYDFPPTQFWVEHQKKIAEYTHAAQIDVVVLIMGSIDRDRIDDKSCVLYRPSERIFTEHSKYLLDLLESYPSRLAVTPLRISMRTEMGIEIIERVVRKRLGTDIDRFDNITK